jgi:uncharacterized damage-inducible protein DinB
MLKQAFVLTALIAATAAGQTSAPSVTREARALWKSNIGYIVQAAEELPEAMYAYKPTPDVRSFAALFGHIAGSQKMYCAMALGDKVPDEGDVEAAAKTKAALVAALKESNAYCEKAYALQEDKLKAPVDVFGETHPRLYPLLANAAHNGEHYGNIVTYMRLNKLVPPSSRPRSGGD